MAQRYFATTAPGLEDALLREIRDLGGRKAKTLNGGVEFEGTHAVFYRANLELRCANRLVLRVDDFRARDVQELYRKTRRYEWNRLLSRSNAVYVRASSKESQLIHTGRIAQTVMDGLRDHFTEAKATPPRLTDQRLGADQLLLARLADDRCEISLDASGELLYRRGWRTKIGDAPIRETTAAALLKLADWQTHEPLIDPMCGSGTFVIEAAQMAAHIAAGRDRDFAFWKWANFRPQLWLETVEAAKASEIVPEKIFFGRDLDKKMASIARENAKAGGVSQWTEFLTMDVRELAPPCPKPGLVICNPPYGERLADAGAIEALVKRFSEHFSGWRLALLLPASQKLPRSKVEFEERASFLNGGIAVRFWMGRQP